MVCPPASVVGYSFVRLGFGVILVSSGGVVSVLGSPRFLMPAGSQGVTVPRYSCYVRLHDASRMAWNFGLVRLEAFKPELLDPLCALALLERQPAGSHDRRFDRHLSGVRAVEDLLRARRPTVFSS